ncbi:SRPBCC family protein [Chitinivorax sp. PXF-14]|uniref:SRPBCC family protein n=1 Tax=Chitinivorax sp. PXF-14 TaxID=3230488 RepID=UPI003467E3AB
MQFEHIVVINDPNNPMLADLSPSQIWQGLVMRVEAPQLFLDNVERVTIEERGDSLIVREMQLGKLLVRDRIHLEPARRMHFETEPSELHGGGKLTVTLESPAAGTLLLRFAYETPHDDTADTEDAKLLGYLKAAYRANDVDAVRKIRELAEAGKLGD